jgi:hypothetical protein
MDKLEGAELDRPGHIITRTKPGLHNPHTHAQQTEINTTPSALTYDGKLCRPGILE